MENDGGAIFEGLGILLRELALDSRLSDSCD